jgi:aspartate kinase
MPIVVQKFGGSSVSDVQKIRQVAERVKERRSQGYQPVVVVSAMGDTTDELLGLAKHVSPNPPRRELDMLLTCGERISMALLSMALQEMGVPAISFTGSQSGIITDGNHAQARIIEVRPFRIFEELDKGNVVIVAGYQGVSKDREVTTLGRGGSDTTAVALAAALAAESCEIYSDVDGVFSADPRMVPNARKLTSLSYEEMQELAHAGARVLNAQAVEFAKAKGIVIHARMAHGQGTGSRVEAASSGLESRPKAVATDGDIAVLTLKTPEVLGPLASSLSAKGCRLRLVGGFELGDLGGALVVLPLEDVHGQESLRAELSQQLGGKVTWRTGLASVTLVGAGVGTNAGLLHRVVQTARHEGVQLFGVQTSPPQISVLVEAPRAAALTRKLHRELVAE